MTDKETSDLLIRFVNRECSPEEIAGVETWYTNVFKMSAVKVDEATASVAMNNIWRKLEVKRRKTKIRQIVVAMERAAIIAGVMFLCWKIAHNNAVQTVTIAAIRSIPDKAILKLGDGQIIDLDRIKNGELVNSFGIGIRKVSNDQIVYYKTHTMFYVDNFTWDIYNIARHALASTSIPNGRKYTVILADGTKVCLNAATTLQYPNLFTGNERGVALTGEAYFEVAKNAKPFILQSGDQTVRVLGTHFNVSCYPEETVRTTLLEGKVKVQQSSTGKCELLTPGQQASLTKEGLTVNKVNPKEATAWIDGTFLFKRTPMKDVFRELSRWYNVDISVSPDIEATELSALYYTSDPIKIILDNIESITTVKFSVNGNHITAK